jgi:hypothetical protein
MSANGSGSCGWPRKASAWRVNSSSQPSPLVPARPPPKCSGLTSPPASVGAYPASAYITGQEIIIDGGMTLGVAA